MEKIKIRKLYDKLAPIYDITHHIQTLWADDIYRKKTVEQAEIKAGEKVLELGTGTCLTALIASNYQPQAKIIAVDFSEKMLEQARKNIRGKNNNIQIIRADIENLPFHPNFFDKIITVYGLGGVQNIQTALEEVIRVSKPNSIIVCSEMSETPKEFPLRRIIHKYIVEPLIKYVWKFRDLDLQNLFTSNNIEILYQEFLQDRIFGSTTLVKGKIIK